MAVLIENVTRDKYGVSYELSSGKRSAHIRVESDRINVCVRNASHRVWRGFGRFFDSFAEAKDAYKSSAVKSMIDCVAIEETGVPA